jgi:hypothetical protein
MHRLLPVAFGVIEFYELPERLLLHLSLSDVIYLVACEPFIA